VQAVALLTTILWAYFAPVTIRWQGDPNETYRIEIDGQSTQRIRGNQMSLVVPRARKFHMQIIHVKPSDYGWESGYIEFAGPPQRYYIP
jgi:hypothetical protein